MHASDSNIKTGIFIIADDYGWHPRINHSIIKLARANGLSGASLAANSPYFDHAIASLRESPFLETKIGVHLNIFRGSPLTQYPDLQGIVKAGCFRRNALAIAAETARSKPLRKAVFQEFRAQIERLLAEEVPISFINGEKHLHCLPWLWPGVVQLATEYRIPYLRACQCPPDTAASSLLRLCAVLNRRISDSASPKLCTPCRLYGVGHSGSNFCRMVRAWIEQAPMGISEIVCHPGLPMDQDLEYPNHPEFLSYLDDIRCREFDALWTLADMPDLHRAPVPIGIDQSMPAFSIVRSPQT